nr:unnamed protein product [Digitaria exilis]
MASTIAGDEHLHVRVVSRRLVKASDSSIKPHVLAVSNLDLIPQTTQGSLFVIYPKPPTTDFNTIVAAFEADLPSLLNHFFPFAGRIVTDRSSGLPEVHCNNQGAELVVSEVAGVALASLDYGNLSKCLRKIQLPYGEDMALSVQLVSFACGGFTVAWSTNHVLVDASAMSLLVTASRAAFTVRLRVHRHVVHVERSRALGGRVVVRARMAGEIFACMRECTGDVVRSQIVAELQFRLPALTIGIRAEPPRKKFVVSQKKSAGGGDDRRSEIEQRGKRRSSGSLMWPMLTRSNYSEWAMMMKCNFKAMEIWEVIEPGGKGAMGALLRSVPKEMWTTLGAKNTVSEAWAAVKSLRQGADRVKEDLSTGHLGVSG